MPSARELLEQADALMRRNRAGVVDTEIPELTEIVAMVAAPAASPVSPAAAVVAAPVDLDDVPELTEAVEEIEIESIVELPEDLDESSGWLHHDPGEWSVIGGGPSSLAPGLATREQVSANVERATRSALSVVGKAVDAVPAAAVAPPQVANPVEAAPVTPIVASPVVAPAVAAKAGQDTPLSSAAPPAAVAAAPEGNPATPDEWARWEVLADEIRMQVLQRIDIFTDTRLRDQLAEQLRPIVDRASAEMVATINTHVGGLLRAYIAEAIEREIEKWRGSTH